MPIQKFSAPEPSTATGFIVTDLDGAARSTGLVRCAKKILVDGAKTLARSQTYMWASLGRQVSGASAGINATGDDRQAGLDAFVTAAKPLVESGSLSMAPAKGVSFADLEPLASLDKVLSRLHGSSGLEGRLLAASAVAAAAAALGSLEGRTFAIEGAGLHLDPLVGQLTASGAAVVAVAGAGDAGSNLPPGTMLFEDRSEFFAHQADVLMCGSKAGLVDHQIAAILPHEVVVPIGPVPVTARGLAVAKQRSKMVLPDFVTTSGPHFVELDPIADDDSLLNRVTEVVSALITGVLDHPDGPLLAACYSSEDFLRTWRDELPFGRPIA